jgi:hypothetical protein
MFSSSPFHSHIKNFMLVRRFNLGGLTSLLVNDLFQVRRYQNWKHSVCDQVHDLRVAHFYWSRWVGRKITPPRPARFGQIWTKMNQPNEARTRQHWG